MLELFTVLFCFFLVGFCDQMYHGIIPLVCVVTVNINDSALRINSISSRLHSKHH